jgi:hypothetical protein
MHVFHMLVLFFLFTKEKPVFPVLMSIRQRIAHCFHVLYAGMVRWMKPRSTSLLLGTIADIARGKSELLVENALLRQQLIILRRQVKRPTCGKTDRFLLVLLARMLRTWKQALFIACSRRPCFAGIGSSSASFGSTSQRLIRDNRRSPQRRSP